MPGFISAVNPSVTVPVGCTRLYYICFLNGFAISSVVFMLLHRFFPANGVDAFVNGPMDKEQTMRYYQEEWMLSDCQNERVLIRRRRPVLEMPKTV